MPRTIPALTVGTTPHARRDNRRGPHHGLRRFFSASLHTGPAMSQIPVTAEGKRKLHGELDELTARVPQIARAIEEAREKGDLKENAEYHAAREEMSMINARIADLKSKLSRAVVVDESQIDTSAIAFGATVTLSEGKRGSEDWQLVGEGEDDVLENKILTSSPMGRALIGKKVGDTVIVQAPVGDLKYVVKKIRY
jgi:transcription elongation factor GreA